MFNNKTLLITGGTGSFGNEVLNFFLDKQFKEIRIFSRDEKKQEDMRLKFKNKSINFIVGDVRDYKSIDSAVAGSDFIFHAAALKQVPSCEFYPLQAIATNITGAENLLESAANNNVEKVVVLSTDKAVYPINTMGLSKAMMEKLMISKSRLKNIIDTKPVFCATRYGNVMASRGSVIPLFIQQIKSGELLTITDPTMTRFMMSLKSSVELVMFAFENAKPGDIYVQKAPAATVMEVATVLLDIFNAKNEIKIIGARHGEKKHETLCSKEEMAKAQDLGQYYRIPADMRDLNYSNYITDNGIQLSLEEFNSENAYRLSFDELKKLLLSLDYVQSELASN